MNKIFTLADYMVGEFAKVPTKIKIQCSDGTFATDEVIENRRLTASDFCCLDFKTEIPPIPLTIDFLRKNAKEVETYGETEFYFFDDFFGVKVSRTTDKSLIYIVIEQVIDLNQMKYFSWFQIENVNELQRTLNLVGLDYVSITL